MPIFFYKTNRFDSIRIMNRIESNRESECSSPQYTWSTFHPTVQEVGQGQASPKYRRSAFQPTVQVKATVYCPIQPAVQQLRPAHSMQRQQTSPVYRPRLQCGDSSNPRYNRPAHSKQGQHSSPQYRPRLLVRSSPWYNRSGPAHNKQGQNSIS